MIPSVIRHLLEKNGGVWICIGISRQSAACLSISTYPWDSNGKSQEQVLLIMNKAVFISALFLSPLLLADRYQGTGKNFGEGWQDEPYEVGSMKRILRAPNRGAGA